MRFNTISEKMDQYISPLANKLSQQRRRKQPETPLCPCCQLHCLVQFRLF